MICRTMCYFNHSIHVNKGVGCSTCHGPVDQMPIVYGAATLQMEWCLECHRAPAKDFASSKGHLQHELASAGQGGG